MWSSDCTFCFYLWLLFSTESSALSARVTTKALPFTHRIQTCHTFHVSALSFFFFIRGVHWLSRASASLFLWAMKKGINRLSQWSVSHCLAHLQPVNSLLARHREDVLNLLLAETWTSPEGGTGRAADVSSAHESRAACSGSSPRNLWSGSRACVREPGRLLKCSSSPCPHFGWFC